MIYTVIKRRSCEMKSGEYAYKQLLKAGAPTWVLAKPEVRHLPSILDPGETIEAFVYGTHTSGFGFLLSTNKRLLFIDKKFVGLQVDDIPYERLAGVEYDSGIRYGKVTVFTRAKDFSFRWVKKDFIPPFVRTIEGHMHESKGKDTEK